ncbi:hypothetical protein D9757_006855 [Collybiopsis confluens]|uniref:FAD-binding PCMH-type domain-containing protein n=1 Tax=Collybiopsis confluens TaxID=2823264 RepID=A0A8H5MAV2_9AGAR|nr:hypothetical protein D9757_006855 [Collybiopsis confluens]
MASVTDAPQLADQVLTELAATIRGQIFPKGDSNFVEYTTMFNGNVVPNGQVVVCPLDAEDVSKIVLFCRKHSLSPSVKAGGFGTAGWAVGGDVIMDMSRIVDIDIEPPNEEGSFTSIRDMAPSNSKGKRPAANPGKRRREDDDALRTYSSASGAVGAFLQTPALTHKDTPPPHLKRRLDSTPSSDVISSPFSVGVTETSGLSSQNNFMEIPDSSRTTSSGSGSNSSNSPSSPDSASGNSGATSGSATTPERSDGFTSNAPFDADPFGYLDNQHRGGFSGGHANNFYSTSRTFALWPTSASSSSSTVAISTAPTANLRLIPSQTQAIHPHAYVTFGAGMRQKEVDQYTANNPLSARSISGGAGSVPYHVPLAAHPTGSTVMLMGGFGFLGRLYGLSIDNLVEVEMVLADGRIVIVNEKEHPDLWWALRGAGPAFGIAVRYKAKAYPVPVVFAGNLIYRFHRATAASLIKHFRDCIKNAPRELYANVLLTAGPAGKDDLVVIQMCYVGAKEKGQEYLAALASWDGEKCLLNEVNEKSFLHQQDSVAQVLRGKRGRQWFIRSTLVTSLPDEVIHQTVLKFDDSPLGCTWLFELAGGAIADFEDSCVPKSQRDTLFTVAALHQWELGVDDVVRSYFFFASSSADCHETEVYNGRRGVDLRNAQASPERRTISKCQLYFQSTFLGRHESPARTMACYGSNWDRLKELKKTYDPRNVFRNSFWPLDAKGESVQPWTHEPSTPASAGTSFRHLYGNHLTD